MGCPCKGKKRAVTASAPKAPSQPPGSRGKPLVWNGEPDKKTEPPAE